MKTAPSAAVQVDHAGAFRIWAPPPLAYPDMLPLKPHGVVSVHTANHTAAVIPDTYEYCATVMKLMTTGKAKEARTLWMCSKMASITPLVPLCVAGARSANPTKAQLEAKSVAENEAPHTRPSNRRKSSCLELHYVRMGVSLGCTPCGTVLSTQQPMTPSL